MATDLLAMLSSTVGKQLGSRRPAHHGRLRSANVASNDTEEGRAQNRRVEVVVMKR